MQGGEDAYHLIIRWRENKEFDEDFQLDQILCRVTDSSRKRRMMILAQRVLFQGERVAHIGQSYD